MKRYEQIPHTADMAAKIYGKTEMELFENAAFAMFDMTGDLEGLDAADSVKVTVEAPDIESLLVAWLNELLYLSGEKQTIFSEFHVVSLGEDTLTAEARGQKLEDGSKRIHSEIKAATYHNVEIRREQEGYEVTVVFDV